MRERESRGRESWNGTRRHRNDVVRSGERPCGIVYGRRGGEDVRWRKEGTCVDRQRSAPPGSLRLQDGHIAIDAPPDQAQLF